MRKTLVPWVAWLLAGVIAVLCVPTMIIAAGHSDLGSSVIEIASAIGFLLVGPIYAVTSAIIISRQPRNVVGWLLMTVAVGLTLSFAAGTFLIPASAPVVDIWWVLRLSFESWSWVLFIFPVFHLLLVFPTGRLLSPRWRILVVLEGLMVFTMIFLGTFAAELGPEDGAWTVPNPIGFITRDPFDGLLGAFWGPALLLLAVSGFLAAVLRYRRSDSIERQQIKWLLFAVAWFAVIYGTSAVQSGAENGSLLDLLLPLTIMGIGVAVALAVLRYRLYEIDRIVSRTVGYVLVVGVLGSVYALGAIWLPSRLTGGSPLFVAGSTLAVAALFNPLRRRVLHWVDRRFYRSRYDAERVAGEFASRLQDRTDVDRLSEDWVAVVAQTMQPSSVGVWVRS
jgi:hypothetical protein